MEKMIKKMVSFPCALDLSYLDNALDSFVYGALYEYRIPYTSLGNIHFTEEMRITQLEERGIIESSSKEGKKI
jgi:hypothetical protein